MDLLNVKACGFLIQKNPSLSLHVSLRNLLPLFDLLNASTVASLGP